MRPVVGRRFAVGVVVAAIAWLVVCHAPLRAQKGEPVDGGIWQFEMTKQGTTAPSLKGRFRLDDDVIYQKEKPSAPEFTKKIGVNKPKGRRTHVEFDGLRAHDDDHNPSVFKGSAALEKDGLAEWSGVFTDGDGAAWDMKLTRVKK